MWGANTVPGGFDSHALPPCFFLCNFDGFVKKMSNFTPNRDDIISMVARHMYSAKILNNAHRGDIVEMMVLSALGSDWRMVSLGWHPWDLQYSTGAERVRIQVRQCDALQLWGKTKKLAINFGWKKNPPFYHVGQLAVSSTSFFEGSATSLCDPTDLQSILRPTCDPLLLWSIMPRPTYT